MKIPMRFRFYAKVIKACSGLTEEVHGRIFLGLLTGFLAVICNSYAMLSNLMGDAHGFVFYAFITALFFLSVFILVLMAATSFWGIPQQRWSFPLMCFEFSVFAMTAVIYLTMPCITCLGYGVSPWTFRILYPAVLHTLVFILTFGLFFCFSIAALIEMAQEEARKQKENRQ